jgi:hypothetical protein
MIQNDGIKKLSEGWESWFKILSSGLNTTEEFSKALNDVREVLAKVLGVNKEFIKQEWITDPKNLELIN